MGLVIGISVPLRQAAVATAEALVLAVCLAWVLANRRFPGRRELGRLVTLTMAVPAPVICYTVLSGHASLHSRGLGWAALFSAFPLLARGIRTAFDTLDPVYGKAARSVGASDWRVFCWIELPLVIRPALAAAGLSFARVLAELVISIFVIVRLAP